jgi:sterol desaturase/sphingolipid hydroxylase (fatty acid hydroxylase superfamily)
MTEDQLIPLRDQEQVQAKRFLPRTILMPIIFLLLHYVASTIAAAFYLIIYILVSGGSVNPLEILGDQAQLEKILIEQYPIIATIYAAILIPIYALYLFLRKQHDSRTLWLEKPA